MGKLISFLTQASKNSKSNKICNSKTTVKKSK